MMLLGRRTAVAFRPMGHPRRILSAPGTMRLQRWRSVTYHRKNVSRESQESDRGRIRCFSTKSQPERNEEEDSPIARADFLQAVRQSLCRDILPPVLTSLAAPASSTQQPPGVILLLGVSGGCDSMALLHALVQLLPPGGGSLLPCKHQPSVECQLHVVHFNHKQRGADSDADERLVQETCQDLGVPCTTYHWNHGEEGFSQDKARRWRQSSMQGLLDTLTTKNDSSDNHNNENNNQVGIILTAHHQDDSIETLLLKLLRGVHITHLQGMSPLSTRTAAGSEGESDSYYTYARPLLNLHKCDIVAFLTSQNLPWREDGSNESNKYLRNRVRNELVPLLSDLVGGDDVLEKRLDNLSQQSWQVHEDLSGRACESLRRTGTTDEIFVLPETDLDLVQQEALHIWTERKGCFLSYQQLQRICVQLSDHPERLQWTLNTGGGWNVVRNGMTLQLLLNSNETTNEEQANVERELQWCLFEDLDIKDRSVDEGLDICVPQELIQNASLVLSTVGSKPRMTLTPPWRKNPIRVREFLRGQKIPLHSRDSASLICLRTDAEEYLVAVFVNPNKWVVNARFNCGSEAHGTRVRIKLA